MKHIIIAVLFCLSATTLTSQTKDSLRLSAVAFQNELNEQYADSAHSPLSSEDRLKFTGHDFYPVDLKYCVEAELKRTPGENTFEMKTTTSRKPMYYKYGELHFKLNGKKFKLNVYQSMDLLNKPEYKDYLFLPFKDLTSGKETYGGGRFIDLKIPSGNKLMLDFNKAYNPYCAYSDKYSCPVPPAENFLKAEVKAGVKMQH
jgi:uncharacterized protein (DUF1684 family)